MSERNAADREAVAAGGTRQHAGASAPAPLAPGGPNSMAEDRSCRRCRHWVSLWMIKRKGGASDWSGDERRSRRGQCHRYAPRASAFTQQWPWTKAEDTCGDFQPLDYERRGPGK